MLGSARECGRPSPIVTDDEELPRAGHVVGKTPDVRSQATSCRSRRRDRDESPKPAQRQPRHPHCFGSQWRIGTGYSLRSFLASRADSKQVSSSM